MYILANIILLKWIIVIRVVLKAPGECVVLKSTRWFTDSVCVFAVAATLTGGFPDEAGREAFVERRKLVVNTELCEKGLVIREVLLLRKEGLEELLDYGWNSEDDQLVLVLLVLLVHTRQSGAV